MISLSLHQEQYALRYPQSILHVRLNDVIFPMYALVCTAIQITQCFVYVVSMYVCVCVLEFDFFFPSIFLIVSLVLFFVLFLLLILLFLFYNHLPPSCPLFTPL